MKVSVTAVLVVAVILATNAQAEHWTVGFKGGASVATVGGDDAGDAGSRTAFVGGAFGQVDLSKSVGIRFEGLYFMKGFFTEAGTDFEGGVDLDYVEFPVLVVGQVPLSKTAALNVFAGPSFSINTRSTAQIEIGGLEFSAGIDEAISDFDVGLTLGGGVTFAAGSVMVVLDARYDLGLTSFDDGLNPGEAFDFKNEAWAFMAGVGFPVGAE